jgi:hypothetical protein
VPVLYVVSVLAIVFTSGFFVALCREPQRRKSYRVWYIRGLVRRNLHAKHATASLRRAA